MSQQTVLVTGGAGYIGSHTCKALARDGFRVVALDSLERGFEHAVKWGALVKGDIADRDLLESIIRKHRPDAVIHFAALAYVGESVERPELYYRNNVGGTLALLEAMRACDLKRIVFSSSCATYGIPQRIPITEDMPQEPINPYGRSKLICEQILRDFCAAHDFSATALRYFNAAGCDPDGQIGENHEPETHLIPLMLGAAAGTRPPLKIFGDDYDTPDGTCIRDYIHVSDLADAHVRALDITALGSGFAALNLGTGQGVSIRQLIDKVEAITGYAVPHIIAPRRPGDPAQLVAEPTNGQERLGWKPRYSDLQTIIETAWRWECRHHNLSMRHQVT